MPQNYLYYGDNLAILRRFIGDESVDLIYLDPPFNSKQSYNVAGTGGARATVKAFEDSWRWEERTLASYGQLVAEGGNAAEALQALRALLGESALLAYLVMMAPRLVELRRILKLTGSLYLHCDPAASHYLKVLLDTVFGAQNFRNEIIWHYMTGGACKEHYAKKHDVLLFYTRSEQYRFYPERIREPRSEQAVARAQHQKGARIDKEDTTKLPTDVWQIPALNPMAAERLGYPTQKPLALLERIILASSDEGDVVLDPFCGSGTALAAAQRLQRHWIGIDIAAVAIDFAKARLLSVYGAEITALPVSPAVVS